MNLPNGLGDLPIRDVIKEHPHIGEILEKYGISCTTCSVGICLLKDVVSIHALGAEMEAMIEAEINGSLAGGEPVPVAVEEPADGDMDVTALMVEEHRLILRMIALLERNVERLEAGSFQDWSFFLDAVDFIRNFADRFHHAKEEDVLFTELLANGMPAENSPVAAMLITHREGRAHVCAMEDAARKALQGEAGQASVIIEHARGYAALLRDHIDKEDHVLYPLAERVLPADVRPRMQEAYRKAESGEAAGVAERYRKLVEKHEQEDS